MKTLDEMIAVMQAARDGKKIEFKELNSASANWELARSPYWDWHKFDYRVKPEPRKMPLGYADINLHRDLFRLAHHAQSECSAAHSVTAGVGVWIAGASVAQSWSDLMEEWEISRDGGKTWQPCWKEES